MIISFHPQNKEDAEPNHGLFDLTLREWAVLLYVADDLTNAEIAEKLCITEKSVVNYRNRIGCKLNLKGVGKLARYTRKRRDGLQKWYQAAYG